MNYELKTTNVTSPLGFDEAEALYSGAWPAVVRSIGANVSEKRVASICEQSIEISGCDVGAVGRAVDSYADVHGCVLRGEWGGG